MHVKHLDLLLASAIALTNMLWVLRHGHMLIIGVLLAFPQVFLLPGYTFHEVLFYKRPVDGVRRLALSFGLSIPMTILSGLLLNLFPPGLNAQVWAIYLGTLTLVLSLIAACLRGKNSTNGIWPAQIRLDIRKHALPLILLIAASGVVLGSFLYSRYSAQNARRQGFTQLWMIQADESKKSCSVLIGVNNFEFTTTKYHILLFINASSAPTILPVHLAPQKTWTILLPITSYVNDQALVEARLYLAAKPAVVYRAVHLTLYRSSNGQQCTSFLLK